MARTLDVYLHGKRAGKLRQDDSGQYSFQYDEAYVAAMAPALSVSLPSREEAYTSQDAMPFFSGLLPDESARNRLAGFLRVSANDPFAMLEKIGGECAGAVSLYPQGEEPAKKRDGETCKLEDGQLQEHIDSLRCQPLLASDKRRLSLAGAQAKMVVIQRDGQLFLSDGVEPTTHILKPIIPGYEDSVHNELFCMRLAALVGIPVAGVEIRHTEENLPYLLIERYDRIRDADGRVHRLHQEDFCQALKIRPENKYERDGGPTTRACLNLLSGHSGQQTKDYPDMLHRVIFHYLIGNADAHGKNFALLYTDRERGAYPSLSPAYDELSTAVYPDLAPKMSMEIGGQRDLSKVRMSDWHALVPQAKTSRDDLEQRMNSLSKACVRHAAELATWLAEEKGIHSEVFGRIIRVIERQANSIAKEMDRASGMLPKGRAGGMKRKAGRNGP